MNLVIWANMSKRYKGMKLRPLNWSLLTTS